MDEHNINERTQGVSMFVRLIKQTNFFVRVRSFIKLTNFPPNKFMNVRFVYRPRYRLSW
ncbi:hypothetical protein Hanom_Chr04g00291111 [Helianthus anomalus]